MWLWVMGMFLLRLAAAAKRPNIIVIVADDMGFNDVSFHGSDEIPTPNIDALAYNGVILNRHYTQSLCTPSRAAFLTGKFPIHLGMQHLVILEPEPWGLPLNETLLPQRLKSNGYKTHAIGKWHLGFAKKEYTPTFRGFDSHFGYWQGLQDYYEHTVQATYTKEKGYDMRRNMSIDWESKGQYSTTLFTDEAVKIIREHDTRDPMFMYLAHLAPHTGNDDNPLQAPDAEIAKFAHIKDPERRIYAAMVSMLDQSVGKVIIALRTKRMLENSIVLFMSDNGAKTLGIHANHGSNYPLRGLKTSNWEGSTRNIAAVWSPLIKQPQRVSNELMHIADWLPTMYSAAGLNISELGAIDGKDAWKSISEGVASPRTDFVYNIDDVWNFGAIRQGDWKYLYGSVAGGTEDTWFGSPGKHQNYNYTESHVLNSEANAALSGLLTYQQITDKTLTTNLLTKEKISQMRLEATIKCAQKPPEEHHKCSPGKSPCLFNVMDDPCEMLNLAKTRPAVLQNMETALRLIRLQMVSPINVPRDANADPTKWNGTWTNWLDYEVYSTKVPHEELLHSPLAIGLISAACLALLIIAVVASTITCRRAPKSSLSKIFHDPMDAPTSAMNPKEKEMITIRSASE